MEYKIEQKFKLRKDTDKSEWFLSDLTSYYKHTYKIKSINAYSDMEDDDMNIDLVDEKGSYWSVDAEFLDNHFECIDKVTNWKKAIKEAQL